MSSSDGGYIAVNYSSTNDVYDGLVQATKQMMQAIDDLEEVINPLMGTWQGISSDAWQAIQKGWTDQIAKLNQDLSNNAGVLSEMAANYSTTDNNLALQWQDIALG